MSAVSPNLLDKASIITTPTAYETGKLLNIKPLQTLGAELVQNGDFATDSDWSLGTGWSIVNGKLISDGSNTSFSNAQQSNATVVGNKYQLTLTVEAISGAVEFKGSNVYTRIDTLGVGTHNFVFVADAHYFRFLVHSGSTATIDNVSIREVTNQSSDFTFARSTTATRVNEQGLIEDVAANLPRIDYTDGTNNGCLLLEPQSTNIITYSEDFSQWTNTGSETTDTANALISPSGLLNATKLQEANSNFGYHRLTNSITASSNTDYSLSFFAKKGTISYVQLLLLNTSNSSASSKVFDLENGVVGETILYNGTLSDSKIEDFGNGWYRCSIVAQLTTTPNTFRINLANAATGNTTNLGMVQYTGNSNGNIYIWGAQLEELSFPTSYIPTSGSTVTRNADACTEAGNTDLIESSEGVLYAEISALADSLNYRFISISDGTSNNRIYLQYSNASNQIQVSILVGGVQSYGATHNLSSSIVFNKIAVKWKLNDFSLYVNGVEVSTSNSNITFPANTLNKINFTNETATIFDFEGKVKSLAVFKEALTDAQLTALTTQ